MMLNPQAPERSNYPPGDFGDERFQQALQTDARMRDQWRREQEQFAMLNHVAELDPNDGPDHWQAVLDLVLDALAAFGEP